MRTGSTRMVQMTCSRACKSQLSFVTDFSCLTTCMFSHGLAPRSQLFTHNIEAHIWHWHLYIWFGVSAADLYPCLLGVWPDRVMEWWIQWLFPRSTLTLTGLTFVTFYIQCCMHGNYALILVFSTYSSNTSLQRFYSS